MSNRFYRKALAILIVFMLMSLHLSAQSLMPSDSANYLQNGSNSDYGDIDRINVIFFEIPDTVTSTLYFGVRDPGVDGTSPDQNSGTSDFYLIGGSGAISDANAKLIDYTGNETSAFSGSVLSSFTADATGIYNNPINGWYYFPQGVSPSQGEHIGNKYYFKVVVDARTSGTAEVNDVTLRADVAGNLDGTYWNLPSESSLDFYVWYDVDNGNNDPAPGGGLIGIEVEITSNDTAAAVAAATAAALNAYQGGLYYSATSAAGVVTVTHQYHGNATLPTDGTVGGAFAAVTTTTGVAVKNAYQLDVSLHGTNAQDPTTVTGAKSFAYNLCFDLATGLSDWDLYPYVPESALATDYIIFHNWDFDLDESINVYVRSDYVTPIAPPPTVSGNLTLESQEYLISTEETNSGQNERNGTWRYNLVMGGAGSNQNMSEIWVTIDNENIAPLDDGTPLRMYSSPITTPAAPDSVVVSYDDGEAIADNSDTELISLQIVDSSGDAANYSRDIYVTVTDNDGNLAEIVTVNGAGYGPAGTALVTTDDWGFGTFEISRPDNGDADTLDSFLATITAFWNGDGSSDSFGTSSSDSVSVTFIEDPPPAISSQFNTIFTEPGADEPLSDITISDAGSAEITAANDIRIRIPAGLNATFETTASITASISGVQTGRLADNQSPESGTGTLSVTDTLTYADANKTAIIYVQTDFVIGDILQVSGLLIDSAADSDSIGYLELSVDGGTTYVSVDDKFIEIKDSNATFTWTGPGTNWNDQTNWDIGDGTPGDDGFPDLATENAIIPDTGTDPVLNVTAITINNLTIYNGASVSFNGNDIDINGTFSNDGTLFLTGGETTNINTVMDVDSGTVEYTGAGPTLNGGYTYYNVDFSAGNWTLGSGLTVNNDFLITGTATLNAGVGPYNISVSGNWTEASSAGTPFVHNNNTVTFNDSSKTTVISGSTTFYNVSCTTPSKILTFEAAQTQIIDTGGSLTLTGSAGNLIVLQSTSGGSFWTLQYDGSSQSLDYISVEDGDVTGTGVNLYPLNSTDAGGNNTNTPADPIWDFTPTTVWDGSVSTDWSNDGNWSGIAPTAGLHAVIPDVSGASNRFPTLTAVGNTNNLTIDSGASVDTGGFNLTVAGTFSNDGTLTVDGTETLTLTMDVDSGLVVYDGVAGGSVFEYGTPDYYDLQINSSGQSFAIGADLAVANNLTVTAGTLNTATNALTVSGNLINSDTISGTTGNVSVTGTSGLSGSIITANADITLTDVVTLTGNSTLDTGATGGNITISNTVDGAFSLTTDSGTGTVTFGGAGGAIGSGTALTSLLIDAATVASIPSIETAVLEINSTGAASDISISQAGSIISSFAASVATGRSVSLSNNTANLTIPSGGTVVAGNITASGGTVNLQNTGSITLTGNISTGTGSVTLDTLGASVIDGNGAIYGDTINLQTNAASSGFIGASANNIETHSSGGAVTANLNVGGGAQLSTYIDHQTGNLNLASVNLGVTPAGFSLTAAGLLTIPASAISVVDLSLISTGGAFSVPASANLTASGSFILTAGAGNLDFNAVLTKTGAGTMTLTSSTGTITDGATGYIVNTAGTTELDASGAITLDHASNNIANMSILSTGNNVTLTYGNATSFATTGALNNLTVSINPSSLTLSDNLDVNGILTVSSGTLIDNGQTMNLAGNVDFTGGALTATGSAIFDGTSDLTSNGQAFNTVSLTGTSITLQDAMDVNGILTVSAGTLIDNAQTMRMAGNVDFTGGALTATGTAEFDGTTALTSAAEVFNNVELGTNGAGSLTTADQMEINGTITIGNAGATTLNIDSDTLLVAGHLDLTNLDTFTVTGSTVEFDGAANQNLTSATNPFNNVTVSGASVTLQDLFDVNGTLAVNTATLIDNAQTMRMAGNVDFTGGALTATGTAEFDGTGNLTSNSQTFNTFNVTGTSVTLQDALDIDGNLTVSAGALIDNAQTMTLAGNVNFTGGALTATGTAEFDGTTSLTSAAEVFNNVALGTNGAGSLTTADQMEINGTITIGNAGATTLDIDSDTVLVAGHLDLTNLDTFTVTGSTVEFDGAANQNLTSAAKPFNNLTVSGMSVTLQDLLDVNGTLTVNTATLIDNTQTMRMAGNVDFTAGTLTATGIAEFDGTTSLTSAAEAFNNVELGTNGAGSLTTADQMEINGTITIGNAGATTLNIDSDTLLVAGHLDLTNLDTFTVTGSTVEFDGAANQNLTSATNPFNNVTVSGASVTLQDLFDVNGTLAVNTATLIDNAQTMRMAGNVDFTGGSLTATGTAQFDGTGNLTSNNQTFNTFNVTGTSVTLQDALDINGNLTVSAGTLIDNAQTMTLAGDVNFTGGALTATGTAEFDGTTSLTSAAEVFNNVVLGTNGAGSLTTADQMEINGTITIGNAGATTLNIDSDTLLIAGHLDLTNLDTFTVTGSTVEFDGTVNQNLTSAANPFNNVTVSGTSVTLQDTLDVNGNLTVSTATLIDNGQTVTLAGNYDSTGGTLTATGAFTIDGTGTSTISGANSFNDLNCTVAGKILSFEAGVTQTIGGGGTLTITGAAGNLIQLISSTPSSQWTIDMQGTYAIDYALVVDSAVAAGSSDISPINTTNGGNNDVTSPGWIFPPVVWDGSTDTDWGTGSNWNTGTVPQQWDDVTIANAGAQPATLDGARTVDDLIIQASASVRTSGNTLTLGSLDNQAGGTLYRQGGDTVTQTDTDSGLVVYEAVNGAIQEYGASDYFDLQINNGAATFTTTAALNVLNDITVTAGTLSLGGQALNVTGDFSNAGTFTPGAGTTTVLNNWSNTGTFNSAGSTVQLGGGTGGPHTIASSGSFNNLTITADGYISGAALSAGGTLTISGGALTQNAGILSAGTLTLSGGNLTVNTTGSLTVSTGDMTINNAGSTYTGSGIVGITTGGLNISNGSYTGSGNLSVNTDATLSGGTFSPTGATSITGDLLVTGAVTSVLTNTISAANANFSGAGSITANNTFTTGSLTMSDGTLTGSGNVDINGNVVLNAAAAAFNENARNINVSGDWDETAAVFVSGTGTVTFDGTAPGVSTVNGFNNFTVNGTSVTLTDNLDVNGNLTILSGTLNAAGQQINVAGDWSNSDTFTHGNNLVEFDGAGTIATGGSPFYDMTISAGARTSATATTVANLMTVSGGSLTHSAGVLDAGTLTLSGGNLTVNTTGSLTVSTGDMTINNAGSTYTGSGTVGITTGGLNISNGSYTGSGNLSVNADATLSGGTFSPTGTTSITGDLLVTGAVTSVLSSTISSANANFSGAGSITANNTFTSGSLTMSDGTLDGTGAVDINGNVVLNTAAAAFNENARNINVSGDWDETAAVFVSGTGTVTFDGTAPGVRTVNGFNNFTVNGTSVTLTDNLDVNGNLTILAGTLNAAGQQINVAGNWSNSDTFTHGNNLVEFDGAGSITTGGSPFYDMTISAGARTSSTATTIANLMTVSGGSLTHSGGVLNAGTLTLSGGNLTVNSTGSLTVSTGDMTINNAGSTYTGSGTVGITTGGLNISNGSYTGSGNLSVNADATLSGGTFSPTGTTSITGDLLVTGAVTSVLTNTISTANANFSGAGSITANNIFTAGSLTMSDGTLDGTGAVDINGNVVLNAAAAAFNENARNINVSGDWDETAAVFVSGTGTVTFDGTAPGVRTVNGFNNFTVNGTSVTLTDDLDVNGNLTIAAGTLNAAGQQINVAGNWSNSDTFTHGNNLVEFDGAGSITTGGSPFYDMTISAGARTSSTATTIANLMTVSGGSLTHSAGVLDAGTLTLSGGNLTVNTTGSLTVSTGNMTINNAGSTYSGTGTVDITTGSLNVSAGSYAGNGILTVTAGNIDISGTGTYATLANGDAAITSGDFIYSSTGASTVAGDLTLNGLDGDLTQSNGTLTLNGYTELLGANGDLTLSVGTLDGTGNLDINGNVVLTSGVLNGTSRIINAAADWDEAIAVFTAGTSTVDFDGTTPGLTTVNPFNNVIVSGTSVTQNTAIDVDGNLTINAGTLFTTTGNDINIAGNWLISGAGSFDYGAGMTVDFDGAGGTITSNASPFYDLVISGATYVLGDLMEIDNSLVTSGTFQPGNNQITFDGTTWTTTGTFNHSVSAGANSKVLFRDNTGADVVITGNNTFYDFEYIIPNQRMLFGAGDVQTIIREIHVEGTAGNLIILDSTDYLSATPIQWNINIDFAGIGNALFYYVDVRNSNAINSITPDTSCVDGGGNTNWFFFIAVIASWTEDSDGNGRIDRIRVRVEDVAVLDAPQLPSFPNHRYSAVTAYIEGYEVDTSAGLMNGFDDSDNTIWSEFFIYLVEKEYTDTGATPRWKLETNSSLLSTTGGALVEAGPASDLKTPIDNAPAVFNYTLAASERDKIFIQFSEFVRDSGGSEINAADFTFNGAANVASMTAVTTIGPFGSRGIKELELDLDGDITVDEILTAVTVATADAFDDMETWIPLTAFPAADQTAFPAPYDNPVLLSGSAHRVSDLALGVTGDAILQPVYATDQSQTDSDRGGIGTMRDFTGEGWLQDQPIELTSHINSGHNASTTTPDVDVHFDVDVSTTYRQNNAEGALWLPSTYNVLDFYGIVSTPNPDDRKIDQGTSPSAQLRVHDIDNEDSELVSVSEVEFLYGLPAYNLFAARIEDSSASDWYRQVKPWIFSIHDITEQVGGVTILKNVINPENGETTNLHYELPDAGMVTIQVFDISGALVDVLQRGRQEAGEYSTAWDGRNSGGRIVARGVYFIRVVAPGIDETRKVMVVK